MLIPRPGIFFLVSSLIYISVCQSAEAGSITASAVLTSTLVPSPIGGYVAQSEFVTGDGAGGTIHTIDLNGRTGVDPFGIATISGIFDYNGGTRPANDDSDYIGINGDGNVTINFSQPIVYFGFYWSTPDDGQHSSVAGVQPTNIITINNVVDSSVTQLAQFYPTIVPGINPNNLSYPSDDNYVSFNALGETFNQVVLSIPGPQSSFESDNYSYVIAGNTDGGGPIPKSVPDTGSTITLLSAALLGLAALRRQFAA